LSTLFTQLRTGVVLGILSIAAPVYSASYYVGAGQQLQPVLDAAQPGDTVVLQAGAEFVGSFRLRPKTGTGWITIRTSALSSLPANRRVTPADAIHMPKLIAAKAYSTIVAESGSHHYRIIGVEMKSVPNLYNWQLVLLGEGDEKTEAELPSNIELDRVYIHGDPKVGGKRGITLNSRYTIIKNSWISDFKSDWQDAQAIAGWNGSGPFRIENNYLEASGENIDFGGSTPSIKNLIPSDIVIRCNHLYKPLSWRKGDPSFQGKAWWVKNSFELKSARRVVFERNVVENTWQHMQRGYAIVLSVRTNNGKIPWSVIEDVTIQHNLITHAGGGVNILGTDDNGMGKARNIKIRNNVFDDVVSTRWGGSGILFQILSGAENVAIEFNTGIHSGRVIHFEGAASKGVIYRSNISAHNQYGIAGNGTTPGDRTLDKYAPGAVVTRNVLAGGSPALYPDGNYFPATLAQVGFVDLYDGDYRLTSTSPYRYSSNVTLGADITALLRFTTNVQSK
jgi:hypothetical protein